METAVEALYGSFQSGGAAKRRQRQLLDVQMVKQRCAGRPQWPAAPAHAPSCSTTSTKDEAGVVVVAVGTVLARPRTLTPLAGSTTWSRPGPSKPSPWLVCREPIRSWMHYATFLRSCSVTHR